MMCSYTFITMLTSVRFLSGVSQNMALKVSQLCKAPSTHWTFVWLLTWEI